MPQGTWKNKPLCASTLQVAFTSHVLLSHWSSKATVRPKVTQGYKQKRNTTIVQKPTDFDTLVIHHPSLWSLPFHCLLPLYLPIGCSLPCSRKPFFNPIVPGVLCSWTHQCQGLTAKPKMLWINFHVDRKLWQLKDNQSSLKMCNAHNYCQELRQTKDVFISERNIVQKSWHMVRIRNTLTFGGYISACEMSPVSLVITWTWGRRSQGAALVCRCSGIRLFPKC